MADPLAIVTTGTYWGSWRISIEWGIVDGRLEAIGVGIHSWEQWRGKRRPVDGALRPVSRTLMRDIPIASLIEDNRLTAKELLRLIAKKAPEADDLAQSLNKALRVTEEARQLALSMLPAAEREAKPARPARLPDAHYAKVAAVYDEAMQTKRKPTKAVERHWAVSYSTAARWVATARKKGLLGETTPGKAGAVQPRPTKGGRKR